MWNPTYTIESIDESLPYFDITSSLAFVIESINSSNIGAFVIASKEEEVLRVLDLVAHEEKDRLQ